MEGVITLSQTSEEGRRMWENAITQAYLLRLNKYAFEKKLISEDAYKKMEIKLRIENSGSINTH